MLTLTNPDVVLVQHKPDRLLDDFQYLPLKGDVKVGEDAKFKFDIDTYINQLVLSGHQIVYSYDKQKQVSKALNRGGIFPKARYPEETEEEFKERVEEMKEFGEIDVRERINSDSITTIGMWATSHNKPVILSDIPEYIFRRNVARHESLLEMRDLLREA